jgi:hypothetical protein
MRWYNPITGLRSAVTRRCREARRGGSKAGALWGVLAAAAARLLVSDVSTRCFIPAKTMLHNHNDYKCTLSKNSPTYRHEWQRVAASIGWLRQVAAG